MLKNFGIWFVCFGLSFLAENFGLASQGFAFLIIFLGTIGLIIVFCIFCCIFGGFGLGERLGIPLLLVLAYVVKIAIILFATWAATQLFDVDFYVAFQIMTFGQCLCTSKSQKD